MAFSGLVLAMVAVATVAGTVAAFVDTESASSNVIQAGTVEIRLSTTTVFPATDTGSISFLVINTTCDAAEAMGSNDVCEGHDVAIWNGGNLTFSYIAEGFVDPPAMDACWDVVPVGPASADGDGPLLIAPGASEIWSFLVALEDDAPNGCQGQSAEVGIKFTATET